MKKSLAGLLSVVAMIAAMTTAGQAKAGDLLFGQADHVLGIGIRCDHVIDLLIENRMRRLHGFEALDITAVPQSVLGPVPLDIEMTEIAMITDATDECGPTYQISFRNNSRVPVGHFAVTAVSVLAQIHPLSPSITVQVPRMEPGEVKCIQMKMPLACLTMGHANAPFDTLVVAIDSFDMVPECHELNNVLIIKRPAIQLLEAAAVEETTVEQGGAAVVAPGQAPVQAAPAVPAQPGQAPAVPAPAQKTEPSPLDNIDLDELDLGDDDADADADVNM